MTGGLTDSERLAAFVARQSARDLSPDLIQVLKIRVLDSISCAIGSLRASPIRLLREHLDEFGGPPYCSLIGGKAGAGKVSLEDAAFFNGALIRYLDFNDSFLAPGETCHPSDNLGALLAAAEYADAPGMNLLLAMAVAYQVQCRLSEEAPVRAKGFDHTVQGAYSVAAGVSKLLGLPEKTTANALSIAGNSSLSLRVVRTGILSNWKGLAFPEVASTATRAVLLAMRGITGPLEVFEGKYGLMDSITGPFRIDWEQEALDRAPRTIIKKYNAEIHSQSVIEGILELKRRLEVSPEQIRKIDIEIFDVAYQIIGQRVLVRSKEDADHSLAYIAAVAWLDDEVMPDQYRANRIDAPDVQDLLKKIEIRANPDFSKRFPSEMPAKITVTYRMDGHDQQRVLEKSDYEGFAIRPASWRFVEQKFHRLTESILDPEHQLQIVKAVESLDRIPVKKLMNLLETAGQEAEYAHFKAGA